MTHYSKTTTTSERGYLTLGCSHTRLDRGWKGRSIGSSWWWSQLRYQESLAGHHSQETKETIKRSVTHLQPIHFTIPAPKKTRRRRRRKTQKGGFVLPYIKAFARLVHKDRKLHKSKLRRYHKVSKRVLGTVM